VVCGKREETIVYSHYLKKQYKPSLIYRVRRQLALIIINVNYNYPNLKYTHLTPPQTQDNWKDINWSLKKKNLRSTEVDVS